MTDQMETPHERIIRTRNEAEQRARDLETPSERTERLRHSSFVSDLRIEFVAIAGRLRLVPMKISEERWSTVDVHDIRLAIEWAGYVDGMKNADGARRANRHLQIAAISGLFEFAISASRNGIVESRVRHDRLARRVLAEGIPRIVVDEP